MIIDVHNGVPRSIRARATYAIDTLMCAAGLSWREACLDAAPSARGGTAGAPGQSIVLLRYGLRTPPAASGAPVVVSIPNDPELYSVEGPPPISDPQLGTEYAPGMGRGHAAGPGAEQRPERDTGLVARTGKRKGAGPDSQARVTIEQLGETVVCHFGADIPGWIFSCLNADSQEGGRASTGTDPSHPPHFRGSGVRPGDPPCSVTSDEKATWARPIVDDLVHLFVSSLADACRLARMPLLRKGLWPSGEDWAIFLSHDVDRIRKWTPGRIVREFSRGLSPGFSAARSLACGDDPYRSGFEQVIALEKSAGIRSTFYVGCRCAGGSLLNRRDITYRLRREKDLISFLSAALADGWEVGLHGSLASSESSGLLARERAGLEATLDIAVSGIRQHYLRLDSTNTWRHQEQAGFLYDATFGCRRSEGFAAGTALPFQPYDVNAERPLSLVELPLLVMDATLDGYRRYSFEQAEESVFSLAETVRGRGSIFSFLLHQNSLDVSEHPYMLDLYKGLLQLASRANPFCATGEEIRRWWSLRAGVRLISAFHSSRSCRFILETPAAVDRMVYVLSCPTQDCTLAISGCDASWQKIEDDSFEVHLRGLCPEREVEIVLGL